MHQTSYDISQILIDIANFIWCNQLLYSELLYDIDSFLRYSQFLSDIVHLRSQ